MYWQAEFDRPVVTITKRQIAKITELKKTIIREALKFLKAEGLIEVIENRSGGRSRVPTYRPDFIA
ncbi:MAG: GntR family transcriptional regulator [Rhodobacteraceae bacterium]|nr:GntR family transcriptional regulator [Paracoccaceae bacterium]